MLMQNPFPIQPNLTFACKAEEKIYMALVKQYIQLSVFDRLNHRAALSSGQVSDIETVRQAVLRDVENLLNTRRNTIKPPVSCRHLNESLYVYGLEDFVSQNPKNPEVRKALKTSIKEAINKFEPRLKHIDVDFDSEPGNAHNLCFKVKAMLYADPVQEPIYFDTWFSINRGEYKITPT